MSNPYKKLRELVPDEPLGIGTVTAVKADGVIVSVLGGGTRKILGSASIGDVVYFRDSAIQGPAPSGSPSEVLLQ
jgi:hypothetical protein